MYLVHYYQSVIRPVLEYACAVWHPALTKERSYSFISKKSWQNEQTQSLENIQRRALQIIFDNGSCDFLIDTLPLFCSVWWASRTVRVIVQTNSSWRFSCTTLSFTSEAWRTSYWQIAISKVISNISHTNYLLQKFVFTVLTNQLSVALF